MNRLLQKFRRDLLGLASLATGLFVAFALISFNPQDPSMNSIGHGLKVSNWCGIVGSFLSDMALQMWGISAWLLVPGLARLAWLAFKGEELSLKNLKLIWGLLLLLVFSTLMATYFPDTKLYQDQIAVGGILGMSLNRGLVQAFNPAGVQVILWFLALVLMIFFSEKTLKELTKWPVAAVTAVWAYDWRAWFAGFWGSGEEKAERKAKKAEKAEKVLAEKAAKAEKPVKAKPKVEEEDEDEEEAPPKRKGKALAAKDADEDDEEEREEAPKKLIPVISLTSSGRRDEQLPLPLEEQDEEALKSPLPQRRRVVMKAKVPQRVENWELPKVSLVEDPPDERVKINEGEIREKAQTLIEKLAIFNVRGEVTAAKPGPAVTMFEFRPAPDVKITKITELQDDLTMALSSESLRILAPIPGRDLVGIETSNKKRETVFMKDMLVQEKFWSDEITLPMALGRAVDGTPEIVDLRKMPHLMVAGTTGSGKSVFTVSAITGLIYRHSPKTLKLILIDPKQVDLTVFEKVPHLALPVVTDSRQAVLSLKWAVKEMEKRYKSLSKFGARKLEEYNQKVSGLTKEQLEEHDKVNFELEGTPGKKSEMYYSTPLPYLVIVVEEFADLMTTDKVACEESVIRLAQKARAAGIHLVLCLQSPRKEFVTGGIKSNIPGRVAFKVASGMESRIILDEMGAERLLATGDMLYRGPGSSAVIRHHAPYLKDSDIQAVTKFWSEQAEPQFDASALKALESGGDGDSDGEGGGGFDDEEKDEHYLRILEWVQTQSEVSTSLIQRKFSLGYPRAARVIEQFERAGVVGPANGSKPRQVLLQNFNDLDA